jgi:penicillin-binding protein 1C
LRQVSAALALERAWSKGEILEAYLNLITFRGELQGIAAAARGLFDKDPSGLSEAESLILASLIPSARSMTEAVARRALRLAARTGSEATAEEIAALTAQTLGRPYRIRPQVALAPHVARMLLRGEGERARSTLDGGLQIFALEALNRQLGQLRERNVHDGAVLVVDNVTGDIIAYAANQGGTSSAPHVDGIRALRQAGSTLKPFLYGLAIEKEFLTAASILEDSPLQIPTAGGLYVPENYDREFLGPVSLRTALSSSLNIPAVRTLMLVTPDSFVERLRALGMTSLEHEADYYGFSLALGSADVTLYELVNAYRTLANRGRWGALRIAAGEAPEALVPVMDGRAAFIVSAILSDREARSATFGLENPLATRFWTAVKTGTSKDMRDNWCVGYSERYTVGVWVGNFWRAHVERLGNGGRCAGLARRHESPPQAVRLESSQSRTRRGGRTGDVPGKHGAPANRMVHCGNSTAGGNRPGTAARDRPDRLPAARDDHHSRPGHPRRASAGLLRRPVCRRHPRVAPR